MANIFSLFLFLQVSKVGIATSTFLTLDYDPVSASMAGAYTAIANSPLAAFSNPAGIANMKSKYSFYASNMQWVNIGSFPAVGGVINLGNRGNIGIYLSGVYIGNMPETKVTEQGIISTGNMLNYNTILANITYAKYYTDKFTAGFSVKIFREDYGGYTSAKNVALDIGSLYWTGFKSLRIGLVIQNLGPDTKPSGSYQFYHLGQGGSITEDTVEFEGYPLPMMFKMGLAMDVIDRPNYKLTLSVDAIHPNDYYEGVNIGADFNIINKISLRTGYSFNQGEKTFAGGFGVVLGGLGIDYSYTYMNTLPAKHRIGIYYKR